MPEPLDAGETAEMLAVARSNLSNTPREPQGWGMVKVVHVRGIRPSVLWYLHSQDGALDVLAKPLGAIGLAEV